MNISKLKLLTLLVLTAYSQMDPTPPVVVITQTSITTPPPVVVTQVVTEDEPEPTSSPFTTSNVKPSTSTIPPDSNFSSSSTSIIIWAVIGIVIGVFVISLITFVIRKLRHHKDNDYPAVLDQIASPALTATPSSREIIYTNTPVMFSSSGPSSMKLQRSSPKGSRHLDGNQPHYPEFFYS